jgi:hypothetical protein
MADQLDGDHRLHKPGVAGSSPAAATTHSVVQCAGGATIHHGVPEEVYFGKEWASRISASDLKEFSTSPFAFYERKILGIAPKRQSKALNYGKRLHSWHELGEDCYWDTLEIVPPEFETAGGGLSKKGEGWVASLPPGKSPITVAERDQLWKATRLIMGHKAAMRLIRNRVDAEFCVQWDCNGTPMRSRIDGATEEGFYDLKTTSDEDVRSRWWSSVRLWKYDLQCAVYLDAALAADWKPHDMRFIVSQSMWPYQCHVVWLPSSVVSRARDRMLRLLDDLRNRMEWDSWMPEDYGEEAELYCPDFMKGESDEWSE